MIAVVGGGITGLTIGYQLSKQGKDVILFEEKEQLGGLAKSFKKSNWDWVLEEYFHHYFVSDKELKNLAKELGLREKLFYQKVQTSVYSQGNIYPFDQVGDFLKFPHLNYFNKTRMGGVIFLLRSLPYLPFYNKYSTFDKFPRLIGKPGWELIWQPLMSNKFHEFADHVSFSWLWARLKKRSSKLGYFKGGTQELISRLEEKIKNKGKILTGTKIEKLKRSDEQWSLYSGNKEYSAEKIILAIPMPSALKLIQSWKEVDSEKLSQLRELKNVGAMSLVFRSEKKFLPGDSYWLNILDKDFPFLVIVEQTNFIDSKYYDGENIVYAGSYYPNGNSIFNKDKKDVFELFSPFLRRLNPSFENYLIDYQVFKYPNAQPVVPVNYSQIRPDITLIPDQLYWATANHIFPWDRGLNYSIKLGKEVASKI